MDHIFFEGLYSSVTLGDSSQNTHARIDVNDMARFWALPDYIRRMDFRWPGEKVVWLEYRFVTEMEGNMEYDSANMEDGTPYYFRVEGASERHSYQYAPHGLAYYPVGEDGYLCIKITRGDIGAQSSKPDQTEFVSTDEFKKMLEEAYAAVTILK